MLKIMLNTEQIKFIDNMFYCKEKLNKKLTLTDKLNWIHFYRINAKLLNYSFNNILENEKIYLDKVKKFDVVWDIKKGDEMLLHYNSIFQIKESIKIHNTIEIFNQKNETNV